MIYRWLCSNNRSRRVITAVVLTVCAISAEAQIVDYSKLPFEGCVIVDKTTLTERSAVLYRSKNRFYFCGEDGNKQELKPPYAYQRASKPCPNLLTSLQTGSVHINTVSDGQPANMNTFFTVDSSATLFAFRGANIKIIASSREDYEAVVLDIPDKNMRKAGIATPAELETKASSTTPLEFTRTADTATISGFHCLRVIVKDPVQNQTYSIWITNDISVPDNAIPSALRPLMAFPVKYAEYTNGKLKEYTVFKVDAVTPVKGIFTVPKDFEKADISDLHQ